MQSPIDLAILHDLASFRRSSAIRQTWNSNDVPPEVATLIVDELALEGVVGLRSCLFLSRTFRDRARTHIFKSIEISDSWTYDHVKQLLHILGPSAGGGVGPFVQEFSIKLSTFLFFATSDQTLLLLSLSTAVNEHSEHLFDDNDGTLADILDKIHGSDYGVTSFSMEYRNDEIGGGPNWLNFSTYLERSIRNLLASPGLRSLCLKNIHNLPTTIFHGAYITHLHLENAHFKKSGKVLTFTASGDFVMIDPDSNALPPPQITSLRVRNALPLLCFSVDPQNNNLPSAISDVRSLEVVAAGPAYLTQMKSIVEKTATTIESLKLTFEG